MMFGRRPHSPERLAAAPALRHYGLATPPPVVDRSAIDFTPLLGRNDYLPSCVPTGYFNDLIAASLVINQDMPVIADAMIPRTLAAALGTPDATDDELASGDGLNILEFLEWQAKNGIDTGQGADRKYVADFGVIPADDRDGIAAAVAHLGSCTCGIRLYQEDMDNLNTARGWLSSDAPSSELVGLHDLGVRSYAGLLDGDLVQLITYGRLIAAPWAWLALRLDEAHGLAWRQLAAPGIDYAALRGAVAGFVG